MLKLHTTDLTEGQKHQIAALIFGVDALGRFEFFDILLGGYRWCPIGPGVSDHDLAVFFAKGGVLVGDDVEPPPMEPCTGSGRCPDCLLGSDKLPTA